jgi:hypothetical protein
VAQPIAQQTISVANRAGGFENALDRKGCRLAVRISR